MISIVEIVKIEEVGAHGKLLSFVKEDGRWMFNAPDGKKFFVDFVQDGKVKVSNKESYEAGKNVFVGLSEENLNVLNAALNAQSKKADLVKLEGVSNYKVKKEVAFLSERNVGKVFYINDEAFAYQYR